MDDDHFDYANWLVVNLMNRDQQIQYAIYAAENVLHIFESEYPNDTRPRISIEATKAYLAHPTEQHKRKVAAAYAAAYAADAAAADARASYAAAYAADADAYAADARASYAAAYAADAAADAADAAYAAAYAADAAVNAAYATYAAVNAADADSTIKSKIINYGKKLLK